MLSMKGDKKSTLRHLRCGLTVFGSVCSELNARTNLIHVAKSKLMTTNAVESRLNSTLLANLTLGSTIANK
jgi:hypothetical protein